MKPKFEVQVSPEYLAKIEADLRAGMKMLASENAFTDYNRGGGLVATMTGTTTRALVATAKYTVNRRSRNPR